MYNNFEWTPCYTIINVLLSSLSLFRNCILHCVAGQIVVKLCILVITTDVKLQVYTLQTVITSCGIISFTTWQWCVIKSLEKNATILSAKTIIDVQMANRVSSAETSRSIVCYTYKHKVIWKRPSGKSDFWPGQTARQPSNISASPEVHPDVQLPDQWSFNEAVKQLYHAEMQPTVKLPRGSYSRVKSKKNQTMSNQNKHTLQITVIQELEHCSLYKIPSPVAILFY